MRQISSEHGN